jgi:hypothetical protein
MPHQSPVLVLTGKRVKRTRAVAVKECSPFLESFEPDGMASFRAVVSSPATIG